MYFFKSRSEWVSTAETTSSPFHLGNFLPCLQTFKSVLSIRGTDVFTADTWNSDFFNEKAAGTKNAAGGQTIK